MWFENFVCGRQANIWVARLGKFVNGVRHMQQLPDGLKETLVQLLDRVKSCAPIQISTQLFSTWICFTDRACESRASVGAVLVDPAGRAAFTFEGELPLSLEDFFYKESKHPIYEVELLPILITLMLWGEQFRGSQVVYWVDNEAAKAGLSLIKGYGATNLSNAIIGAFCRTEAELQLKTWFSRVPTHSNLSDGPSRLDFSVVLALGRTKLEIPWSKVSGFIDSHCG